MLILPAIDLRGGQCVRLRQGDFAQETVFGSDPVAMARAMALATEAGRLAFLAGRIPRKLYGNASSPLGGVIGS